MMLNHQSAQSYDHKNDETIVYLLELDQRHLETHDILMTAWL